MNRDTTIWWSVCDDCETTIAIYPHPDRETDLEHPDEWSEFWPSCPVCGNGGHGPEGSDTPADMVSSFKSMRPVKR